MDDPGTELSFVREQMKKFLLDILYRLERVESAHGIASNTTDGIRSDRLPPLDTDAEQTSAMAAIEKRISRIEIESGGK